MTTSHKWTAVIAVVLAAASFLAIRAYMAEHDARNKAEVITQQANTVIAAKQDDTKKVLADMQTQLTQLAQLKAKTVTTTQIVRELPTVMPLPAGDPVVHEVTAAQAAETANLPDAPKAGDLVIPAASAKDFFDAQVTCKQNAVQLNACTQVRADDEAIIAQQKNIITADETALKGGTFWHRVWHDAKLIGISAGVGVGVGYAVTHH